jgi:hypothetical protein
MAKKRADSGSLFISLNFFPGSSREPFSRFSALPVQKTMSFCFVFMQLPGTQVQP